MMIKKGSTWFTSTPKEHKEIELRPTEINE